MNFHTIELLEHALHGAGAAAAGHGNVELVVVLGHFEGWLMDCEVGVELSGGSKEEKRR